MTYNSITRLNLDLQHVKEYKMSINYTDKIYDHILDLINFHAEFCKKNSSFIDSLNEVEISDLASLLFERDKMDLSCLYDNNDILSLSEACEDLISSFNQEKMLAAALKMKKTLINHYLPEMKAMLDECYSEHIIDVLRDSGYTRDVDYSTGFVSYIDRHNQEYQF